MKITITRALTEIKLLEDRYNKAVRDLDLIAVKQGSKLRGNKSPYKEEDFRDRALAMNNSAVSLYNRILLIKTLIDKSNSVTEVKIGEETMTVQEALVRKKYLELREDYLSKLKILSVEATRDFSKAENENQEAIEKLISSTLTKDMPEAQKENSRKEAESYIEKSRAVEMVDPCKVNDLIEKIEDQIQTFKMNIDFVLSESNSTNYIEIPD